MNKYIAVCGLNCENCEARIATINDDNILRSKVASEWSILNGVTITSDMINCVGCRVDGIKTPYCEKMCPIRKCAISHGFETCGECDKINECKKIGMIIGNNKEAFNNLKK